MAIEFLKSSEHVATASAVTLTVTLTVTLAMTTTKLSRANKYSY